MLTIIGDGLDDFCCVNAEGNLYASINNGDGSGGSWPTFTYIGLIKDNEGFPQDRVRLADIDGDGRADYGVVFDNGDIQFWRNGWIGRTAHLSVSFSASFPY